MVHRDICELRRTERLPLVLPARCRSRSGFLDKVVIIDLTRFGCRIESHALTLHKGDLVVVTPQSFEGICATVRWVDGHSAGVEFHAPLYQPVVDHLHRKHATFMADVTPMIPAAPVRLAA